MPARTVARVLRRHHVPYLQECDPMTGEVMRASRSVAECSEREPRGEMLHVDAKKLGKIPRAQARGSRPPDRKDLGAEEGQDRFDYVHSTVDDHSRSATQTASATDKPTCAAFTRRAARYCASHWVPSAD